MTDQPTSSWPMPLRIASLVAIVGVSGWLVWQTQQQSTVPAPARPNTVAVPRPVPPPPLPAASDEATERAATHAAASGAPSATASVAPSVAPSAVPPASAPTTAPSAPAVTVAAETPPSPGVEPGGNANPTFFHSSKAMVMPAEALVLEAEPTPAMEVVGRNPVYLHSSKAMVPLTLPSLAAPDAGSTSDAGSPSQAPAEPVYIPSSKFADPAIFLRVVEDQDVQSPPEQR